MSRKQSQPQAAGTGEVEVSRRERILDVAERLFADGGFDGVSMRDVATQADVGLPLIVYHFRTKHKLYAELFHRRKTVLEARLAALREPTAPGVDAVVHIVRALVIPVMQIQKTPAGLAYAKLVAREATDQRQQARSVQTELFDPFAIEFIGALRKAMPKQDASYILWAYHFAVGALVMSVFDERVGRITGGKSKPGDLARKTEYLITFIVAGLRGGGRK